MIPGSLSIITISFDKSERGRAIGTWSAISTMVTIGGPILGGALADAGLWRLIFFINVPVGIASLVILWLKLLSHSKAPCTVRPVSKGLAAQIVLNFLQRRSRGPHALALHQHNRVI